MNANELNVLQMTTSAGVYDKTKLSVFGRVRVRSNPFAPFTGDGVLGPPVTRAIDYWNDSNSTTTAVSVMFASDNGRLFLGQVIVQGFLTLMCYEIDPVNLTWVYVGRLQIALPNTAATTHTPRSIRVIDSGTTGWKVIICTIGSVLINGGVFLANKVDRADFWPGGGNIIWIAQTDDVKGVYHLVRFLGAAQTITTAFGTGLNGSEAVCLFGTALAFSSAVFNVANPPTVEPTVTASSAVSSPHFTATAHGLANGDPVILSNAGAIPTGFVATPPGANQTVYFVRDVTANTFNLTATTGGVLIAATSAVGGVAVRRAFGQTRALDVPAKAQTYTATGIAGTVVNNAVQIDTPTTGPTAGQTTVFLTTGTAVGLFPVASLNAGGVAPVGLAQINLVGTGIDFTTIAATATNWTATIQRVFVFTPSGIVSRPLINNTVDGIVGKQRTDWKDTFTNDGRGTRFEFATLLCGEAKEGVAYAGSNTAGQRVVFVVPIDADSRFGTNFAVSPVIDLGATSQIRDVAAILKNDSNTDGVRLSIRVSDSATDTVFDAAAGGWTVQTEDGGVGRFVGISGRYVQIRVEWVLINTSGAGCAAQVSDLWLISRKRTESDEEWTADVSNSIANAGTIGNRAAWQLRRPYPATAVVPPLQAFAVGTADTITANQNTTATPGAFEYSADGGATWLPWSISIPNTAGVLVRWALGANNGSDWVVSLQRL